MALWSDFIQTGKYAGIAFDFLSTRDEVGRVVDRQLIGNRDGQVLQDRAREPLIFDVLAIFVEDDYPDVMLKLRDAILKGGVQEFVHPIFGAFKAMVTHASIDHNADDSIDSATMQLHVEESTEQKQGPTPTRTSTAARANAVRNKVLDVLNRVTLFASAVDALLNVPAAVLSGIRTAKGKATDAASLAKTTADSLEAIGTELSASEVQAQVNGVLADCDSVVQALGGGTVNGTALPSPLPEQYDLVQSVTEMASSLRDMADAIVSSKPALVTFQIDADISLLLWVHAKYKDSSRVNEVLALNPWISDPLLLPAGSSVTAYAA